MAAYSKWTCALVIYPGRQRSWLSSFQLWLNTHADPITLARAMPHDHWLKSKSLNQLLGTILGQRSPWGGGSSDFPPGRSGNQKSSSVAVEKGGINARYSGDNAYCGTQGQWSGRGSTVRYQGAWESRGKSHEMPYLLSQNCKMSSHVIQEQSAIRVLNSGAASAEHSYACFLYITSLTYLLNPHSNP